MKVLVTGANGWVGSALCEHLRWHGMAVRAATRSTLPPATFSDQVCVAALDGQTDWRLALAGMNSIVHLAARVHVMGDTAADPLAEFRRVNVLGTLNLARQAAQAGVRRFVFVSSVKVNGELTQPGHPYTEVDTPAPQDAYGLSKHEAEQGLRQLAMETGMELVVIRPPLVYGPGVKANFASLMRAVQRGWPLPLGAIHNRRSLVGLDNLLDFIRLSLTHPAAANQTFFVSDGQDVSTPDLIRAIARAARVTARLPSVPVGFLEGLASLIGQKQVVQRLAGNLQIDSAKARTLLSWSAPVTLEEGLRRAVNHVPAP